MTSLTVLLALFFSDDRVAVTELRALRGRPALVELPGLEDLGTPLESVPTGWRYLQATSDTVNSLEKVLSVPRIPCVVYVDRFGNPLHWDTSPGNRRRIASGVAEFKKRRKELVQNLARLRRRANEARERDRSATEVEFLLRLCATGAQGYPEIESATERLGEIERHREAQFLEILGGEGWLSSDEIDAKLRGLEQISKGLEIARRIRRDRERIKRGVVVSPRPPGGGPR